ncbi:MAG: radical SAM protein, partial [bacterium]|nr:radical SAM protein [bacterium]
MKCTIAITQQCNLRCSYCYIGKKKSVMTVETARQTIDFIFKHAPPGEKIEIGFFGGEPLLEFDLVKTITEMTRNHPSFAKVPVEFTVVTNGTIFSPEIADFITRHDMGFGISCDGPPESQDMFRVFPDGAGSSAAVAETIRRAVETLPSVMVNAVYHPRTLSRLPEVVPYFSSLGIRQIYLTPDYSASWSLEDVELLPGIYRQVADQYINYYLEDKPHYISLIDGKIAVILREGYQPGERCKMGRGEFAFAPSGNIYPCERLIGSDDGDTHCIGHVASGLEPGEMCGHLDPAGEINDVCRDCGLNSYCMNWCGCSNYFAAGRYNRVGPFICASEKAAILT